MTTNVRFYRLEVLPSFNVDKYKGIFVHVTKTMYKNPWDGGKRDPATIYMTPVKVGDAERMNLVNWLSTRHIEEIASGLWFGGENGWELLSNETTDAAIDAAITNRIATLDVNGYAQATITPDIPAEGVLPNSSTLTIKGIKEVDGKIGIPADSENLDLDIAIDGGYNKDTNKIATQSTVTTAIEALDVNTAVQAVTFNTSADNGNTTLTFKGIKEADGRIAQGDEQTPNTFIVGDAKLNIQIGSDEAFEVFSANAKENGIIKLDGNVFKKNVVDGKNVLSVITKNNDVSSTNPLVTKNDIANLAGAMHYKGHLTGAQSGDGSWPSTVAAGDVYIVTTSFTHSSESNPFEVGDMIVFNSTSASDYKVVQSNITLGTGIGQVAANSAALLVDNLVVASATGIKTIEFDGTNLTSTENGNNTRNLTYTNGTEDTTGEITLYHDVTISDALKVIGKDFTKTIKISSTNRSIEIANNGNTGVVVDLVWNTSMDPDQNN